MVFDLYILSPSLLRKARIGTQRKNLETETYGAAMKEDYLLDCSPKLL